MKKKLFLIIDSDLYIRNYFSTGIVKKLSQKYDVFISASDEINNKHLIEENKNFIGYYSISLLKRRIYFLFNNILLWKYRKKSSSFLFRFYRLLNFQGFPIKLDTKIKNNFFKNFLIKLYVNILSVNFFFKILKKFLNKNIFFNKEILKYIDQIKPDLVIYPTNALEPLVFELPLICKSMSLKSFFLVDNWDNLSSKSILVNQPDYIAVWGEQTAKHAEKIQCVPKSKILICGTPRYEIFFKKKNKQFKNIYNKKYILFLGTSLKFNEETAVEKINNILEKNKDFFNNCYLVYRPHPWRQSKDLIQINKLKKTIIDKQIAKNYLKLNFETSFQPSLNYYPSLISNAEFVIGGLTSMMIESLIFEKKFLALTFNDKINYTNQHIVFKYFTHFREIRKFKDIKFIKNISNFLLEEEMKKMWLKRNKKNKNSCNDLRYIIDNGDHGYNINLLRAINKIIYN
jgi:hypothetical protein